jgi:hypothetical protein
MAFASLRTVVDFLMAAALVAMFSSAASAQYRAADAQLRTQPRANTVAVAQAASRPPAYVQSQGSAGYYPGYGPVQSNGLYGGYLSGGADVINAQGNYMIQRQEANLTREQVQQAKIDTRRKTFDNWLYEREMTPTGEEERERARMEEYKRSRNDPPLTEIWSGKALNDLLDAQRKTLGVPGPAVPLNPEMLAHINVTSGTGHAGIGLLKGGGQLLWPVALQDEAFAKECKKIEQLLPEAVKQGQYGPVPAKLLSDLTKTIDLAASKLKGKITEIDANDYIVGKRYLNELNDSLKVLKDPNAAKYVSGQWSANARTVGELIFNMTKQGLRFAPATRGDQEAYTMLHRAMAYYDETINQLVARDPAPR